MNCRLIPPKFHRVTNKENKIGKESSTTWVSCERRHAAKQRAHSRRASRRLLPLRHSNNPPLCPSVPLPAALSSSFESSPPKLAPSCVLCRSLFLPRSFGLFSSPSSRRRSRRLARGSRMHRDAFECPTWAGNTSQSVPQPPLPFSFLFLFALLFFIFLVSCSSFLRFFSAVFQHSFCFTLVFIARCSAELVGTFEKWKKSHCKKNVTSRIFFLPIRFVIFFSFFSVYR